MTKSNKFGAFGGVFTPSILTILGVIMYMRLPMIIGQAGLFATLGIIVVAHIISITTGLSVSSIATDKKVKAGGTYYIISRSLGLPIGGTLGLALYVGLSFSVSLYLIGFAESFLGFWGYDININNIRIAGSIILLTVTIITFISASLAVKTQYLIMAAIFLSLLSIFFGKHEFTAAAPNFFGSTTGKAVPLMVLFGIYFPAVTGFEAGVSMSGDLKDPKSSIPKGTIAAIALGLLVYIFLAFFFSYTVNSEMLASDPNVLLKISWVPELVVAGIWGATLSSALGSILAAPRILQATAVDKITPKFFARGTKISNEPRNALILTFFIAECGILIGELDVIARIVSVFFITTYGFLNLSSAFEAKTSPDFRPDFKVPYWVGLIGALACMLVMIQLDFLAMMGATVILGLLYLYIKRKELTLESGDAWSSVWASLVKKALLRLNKSNVQSRNWRPNIIMFSGDLEARPYLSKFGIDLIGKLGMISGFELEPSKEQVLIKNVRTLSTSKNPSELIIHKHQCRDIYSGIDEIVRTYGFTGVEPNTILLGWSSKGINKDSYTQIIRSFQRNNFNSVFLSYDPVRKFGNQKTIDIWWNGWGYNFVFSIYLIRHLTSIGEWKDAKVRILVISNDNKLIEKSHETISNVLERYRVSMAVKVIDNSVDNYLKEDIINKESASCDLTIIGLPWESNHNIETVYNQTNRLAGLIGTALFINASSSFEEIDLGFDKGKSGVIDEPVFKEIISVPELQLSKYPKINENIHNIDANGQKVLEIFYLKTFVPYFLESNEFISEIKEIVQMTFNVYSKIPDINDLHKKQKALRAAKSDFYFHINKVLKKIIEEKLALQKQFLETGIDWYTKKLEEDILKFPQRLSINYEKDDFMIHKEDSASMRLFKFRKRISHPFSKKKITSNIRFREIAGYYLKDKRFQFLSHLLNKLEQDVITRASNLRPLITGMDNLIMKYEKQLQHKDFHKESFELEKNDLLERVQDILNSLASIQELYKNRFFVEFRQNLNVLAVEMSKVNINHLIVKKHKNRKYYKSIKLRNESFPEEFYFKLLYYFNKINLDVILRSLKHRIEDKLDKLSMSTTQNLEAGLIRKLEMIKSDALSIKEDPKKINSLKFDIGSIQESIHLQGAFEDLRDEIMELGESLPESLLITTSVIIDDQQKQDAEPEVISVPLRKIALHFLETHFLNSIFEYLEKNSIIIKKTIFLIKDQLSLARFNLENIDETNTDRKLETDTIIQHTLTKVSKEKEKILLIMENLKMEIHNFLNEAFEPLYSHKIIDSVEEFSSFVREYQSKKVMSRFESQGIRIKDYFKRKSARLLYSRSEGVLLARQLMENKTLRSPSENILDFVDEVSPKQNVMEKLPHYYKNLFSGRSSISEDFWVSREHEEAMFSKAVKRFQSGIRGGVMILGERNSGKTAFCRYAAKQHFPDGRIHHIFPLPAGSTAVEMFEDSIRKLTGLSGNLNEIFEALPYGTVVIIHDLELWWERSPDGYNVISKVIELINDFSDKCLFVVNMNSFAYKIINDLIKIEDSFISIISSMPFDSGEIKEMIIRRHHSSGINFNYHKKNDENISEFKLAGLFNKYFDSTKGNPGVALNRWLTNIQKISGEVIHIASPRIPKMEVLENLDDDWQVILIQLIIHKRLSIEKLTKILDMEILEVEEMVTSLKRTGLIVEKSNLIYMINIYAEPYLVQIFKRRGLL